MASFNKIIIIGNLTKEPEHKQLGSGQSVCRLSIASNRTYRNKQTGEMAQDACFVDVELWGQQADSAKTYLVRGAPVLVEGRLKYDTWKDATGGNRHRHSISAERIVFLGSKQDGKLASGDMDSERTSGTADLSYEASQEVKPAAKRTKRSGSSQQDSNSGFDFKDQQPFEEDNLPF